MLPRLAKWGRDELLLITVAWLALSFGLWQIHHWAAVAPLPFFLIGVWFFRDPHREIPPGEDIIVSPADGVVMDLEEIDEPQYIRGPALRLGIFLSPFNVHVNRAPVPGIVEFHHYWPGKFLKAYDKKAESENERLSLGILMVHPRAEDEDGGAVRIPVLVRQISGYLARRIVCDAQPGDELARGERYGMIKFGSRTEIYVPLDAGVRFDVKIGDKVRGGETIVGRLT
jgi:phosphatidylserine decarboxylase